MKAKYQLWIIPLINGGKQIILHESHWRNDGSGLRDGFTNHRFTVDPDWSHNLTPQ